jgi:adenylate kinase
MTDEERRQAVMHLRELRTSPQALGRAMRQSAAQKVRETEEEDEEGIVLDSNASVPRKRKQTASKTVSTTELYKELGL